MSTSLTVLPVLRPMALTSASGWGCDQASRLATPGSRLSRVSGSTSSRSLRVTARPWSAVPGTRGRLRVLRTSPVASETRDRPCWGVAGRPVRRTVGRRVGERQHHLGQRHPVGHGVVQAGEDDRALAVPVDEPRLPQRSAPVQGPADLGLEEGPQLGGASRPAELGVVEVVGQAEVGVVLPARQVPGTGRVDGPLVEDRVGVDQAFLDGLLEACPVQRLLGPHDPVDHHQVVGPVGVQPHGVGAAHRPTGPGGHDCAPAARARSRTRAMSSGV